MSGPQIHPELRRIAPFLPRGLGNPTLVKWSRRIGKLPLPRPLGRGGGDVEVVPVGEIEVRVHRPSTGGAGAGAALLWIHGGGYVLGTAAQDDAFCRLVADQLGVIVASVDYRLAPEHPHPTPVQDCHDALVWLTDQPEVDSRRVAIGGASAGGGLAASLSLLARERGEVEIAFQLLTYPMLDDRTVETTQPNESAFRLWNSRSNRYGWESYLGTTPGAPDVDPVAAPSRHPDLSGLPPAWIGVGTLDLFHDEDVAYANRLAAAGVPCELTIVEGAFHGFDGVAGQSSIGQTFRDDQFGALARGLDLVPSEAAGG